jgi:hypothetical protein
MNFDPRQIIQCLDSNNRRKIISNVIPIVISQIGVVFPELLQIDTESEHRVLVCKHDSPFDDLISTISNLYNNLTTIQYYFDILCNSERLYKAMNMREFKKLKMGNIVDQKFRRLLESSAKINSDLLAEGRGGVGLMMILGKDEWQATTSMVYFELMDDGKI